LSTFTLALQLKLFFSPRAFLYTQRISLSNRIFTTYWCYSELVFEDFGCISFYIPAIVYSGNYHDWHKRFPY